MELESPLRTRLSQCEEHHDPDMEGSYESNPLIGSETWKVDTGSLGMVGAALFIVGEMTGSGILGVPCALAHSGYSGFAMMLLCVVVASYTGLTLSRNWMHVRDQYPHCSNPYPSIGYTSYGRKGQIAVQVCATVTLIGGCCAYVLIAAQSLARFIFLEFHTDIIGYRTCVVIMGLVFLTVLIFGAGRESMLVAICATLLSILFTILIIVGIVQTGRTPDFKPYPVTAKSWFLSFGKFLFAFGGHSAFPNFQKEMKNPRNFPGSVLVAYLIKLVLYVPIGLVGVNFFGSALDANILNNIDNSLKVLNVCILLLVAIQAIMSATILGNPVADMVEGIVGAPINKLLHWKRLTVRLCFVILSVAICEAIPRFDLIMSLIGGTTINAAVFILPSIFHFKLAKKDKWWNFKITFDSLSIVFGLGAGVVCTYASVAHIVDEYSS